MPRYLKKGVEGADVRELQELLAGLGYSEVGTADGDFGNHTRSAVKRFQDDHGLDVDGIVGPHTRNMLWNLVVSMGLSHIETDQLFGDELVAATGRLPTDQATNEPLRVIDIHNQGGARFVVDFESDPALEAASALIFPSGVPDPVLVSIFGPRQVLLEHVTADALRWMPEWLGNAFVQASQGLDPVPETGGTARAPAATGKPYPEIDIDTPEELKSWLEQKAYVGSKIGHVAELIELMTMATENIAFERAVAAVGVEAAEGLAWGGAGVAEVVQLHRVAAVAEVIGVVSKVLAVVGDALLIIWVGYQLIEAFKGERERQRRYGFLYGVMWEALGEADHIRTYNAPGITYSEEELREAFVEGVAEGRAKGAELDVQNGIKVWVAAVAVGEGVDEWAAKTRVLTALYDKAFDSESSFPQDWPTPRAFDGFF